MWGLWWTKWHCDRIFPDSFGFPLSISLHRCSITRKEEKTPNIFITGLHNKPQDCGASVAFVAGPFTTKNKFPNSVVKTAGRWTLIGSSTIKVIFNNVYF
jgi:hypothetical protein